MEKHLPVLATLVAAVDLCREHLFYGLKIMAPWLLIFLIAPYVSVFSDTANPADGVSRGFQFWETLSALLYTVAWGSIAVLWHWRVLRDDSYVRRAVIFDRRVWFYILRGILISIIIVGVALVLALPVLFLTSKASGQALGSTTFFILAGCLLIVIGFIAARLSIALPTIALDVADFGLADAWNATKGNSLRLFFVTWLPLIPLYFLSWSFQALGDVQGDLFQSTPFWLFAHLMFQLADFAFGLLGLTVLSLTYAFFVESGGPRTVQKN